MNKPLKILLVALMLMSTKSLAQIKFEDEFKDFFIAVQMSDVFPDSKTFPDCVPLYSSQQIVSNYQNEKNNPDFNLMTFIYANFRIPENNSPAVNLVTGSSIQQHITDLWPLLTRQPSKQQGSLIPLPFPYVVPGGRFREIYYWDSYFTMLGLKVSQRGDLIRNMVKNFAYLIDTLGFIPNGNRTYYLSRSQPPFFSSMVRLLATIEGDSVLTEFLPQMEKEYNYWMDGKEKLNDSNPAYRRVVYLSENEYLNRYWDDLARPRTESFKEDSLLAKKTNRDPQDLYRNIRAACESGWDFSSRWFKDGKTLETINTTNIIPVDLNCLLYQLEKTIADAYIAKGNFKKSKEYLSLANNRKRILLKYCWDEEDQFYFDYDFKDKKRTGIYSLAALYPLYFKIANAEHARAVESVVKNKFLMDGGVVTSFTNTRQQWDYPNGWPPLQHITIEGLKNFGLSSLAEKITQNWVQNNTRVYRNTGKMLEKYNVMDTKLEAGGGEYPTQDGFGWTNGVLLDLLSELD
jgi:alpha,alpha-trehalase